MNVLLVDDEPLELEQLEYLIHPLFPFWNLYKAADSSQAAAVSQKVKIHLAFLDINLPGKSGWSSGKSCVSIIRILNSLSLPPTKTSIMPNSPSDLV